jgi:hypothetical protein
MRFSRGTAGRARRTIYTRRDLSGSGDPDAVPICTHGVAYWWMEPFSWQYRWLEHHWNAGTDHCALSRQPLRFRTLIGAATEMGADD